MPLTSAGTEGDTRYLAFAVSVDAVDQFQVETNGAKAQYQGQGVENYVMKSGTNAFHGGAFEYFRNTDLDARGFFPAARPIEHQNEYGGLIGGPIKKNKIFFFRNYDGYKYNSGLLNPTLQSIPTVAERTGDFSGLPATQLIYDPASQTCAGAVCTRTPFAGNVIPTNRISPISQSLQSYLPDSDELEHPEQLPAQPAHPTEHVELHRQGGCQPVGQASAVRVLRRRALRHQFHRQPDPDGSGGRAARALHARPHRGGRRQNGAVARYLHHQAQPFEPIQLFLQPHLDSAAKPHRGWELSAEGRHQGLAAERGRRHVPGYRFQRHQFARRLAGNQRPLLTTKPPTRSPRKTTSCGSRAAIRMVFGGQFQALQDNENFALVATFNFNSAQTQGYNSTGSLLTSHRQCLRQLPARRGEQQRHQPERHRRDGRPL